MTEKNWPCFFFSAHHMRAEKRFSSKKGKMRLSLLPALLLLAACLFHTASAWIETPPFVPPYYNQTVIEAFASKILLNPPADWPGNPYDIDPSLANTTWDDSVCGVYYPDLNNRSTYYIVNYSSAEEATNAGAFVTHLHPCGLCSTTKDLAIYMNYSDLTNPVRECALKSLISDQWAKQCLMDIGFTEPCATIWLQDAENTRKLCLDICLEAWIEKWPNNIPANSTNMNPCIACDEYKSGPIFKRVAGRTRRDSGLPSSINRPADEIYPVYHYYY